MGNVKVTAPITVEDYTKQILRWIGLTEEEQKNIICDDSIDSFSEIRMFTEEYISNLSTEFTRRTQDNGEIQFGVRRTKKMKALLHLVIYFYRVSGDPNIVEMNEVMFTKTLDTTMYRTEIRKNIIDQSNTKAK